MHERAGRGGPVGRAERAGDHGDAAAGHVLGLAAGGRAGRRREAVGPGRPVRHGRAGSDAAQHGQPHRRARLAGAVEQPGRVPDAPAGTSPMATWVMAGTSAPNPAPASTKPVAISGNHGLARLRASTPAAAARQPAQITARAVNRRSSRPASWAISRNGAFRSSQDRPVRSTVQPSTSWYSSVT